jgi:hypothetical protein
MLKKIRANAILYLRKNFVLNYKTIFGILSISGIVLLACATLPPFNYWTFDSNDLSSSLFADYGQFISGFLGTLFSLLSIILLFKTLTEQRTQFNKASFQTNFYSLLENHRNILNSICDRVEKVSYEDERGADFFADLAQRIYIDYYGVSIKLYGSKVKPYCRTKATGVDKLIDIYNFYFHIHHSDLGHYFRNLYHFVRFIIESDVDDATKKRHIKILRAQLSNYEILLLAYNCLHKYGSKFKPYVEDYELLQNLNFELELDQDYVRRIIDHQVLIEQYPHLKKTFAEQQHDQKKFDGTLITTI